MQDRYVGDIGDFAKCSLLNHLSAGRRLGISWYLYPDEVHNADGRHISYLENAERWLSLDSVVFDGLRRLVLSGSRTVAALTASSVIAPAAVFAERLECGDGSYADRAGWREQWFNRSLVALAGCDLVFADPDNGLRCDSDFRLGSKKLWKSIPESEVHSLAEGRTAIIYHHNTRKPGGHAFEISSWLKMFENSFAVRMRPYSPRTFFVINANDELYQRAFQWCARMGNGYEVVNGPS